MFNVADWLTKYEHKLNITSVQKQLLRDFIEVNTNSSPAVISLTKKADMKPKRNSPLYYNVTAAIALAGCTLVRFSHTREGCQASISFTYSPKEFVSSRGKKIHPMTYLLRSKGSSMIG